MARTKQTARKSTASKVPRKQLIAQRIARRCAPGTTAVMRKQIEEEEMAAEQQIQSTQTFAVKFDDQEKCQKEFVQGKIIECSSCHAILTPQSQVFERNAYEKLKNDSKLSDGERQKFLSKYEKVWICQFCLTHNFISKNYQPVMPQNPCYLIEKKRAARKKGQEESDEDKTLIFCVDVSSSMDQIFEGKSRLDSVKEAILDEVKRLKFTKEQLKVGVITFGSVVELKNFKNGKDNKSVNIPANLYTNFEEIAKYSAGIKDFAQPIQKAFTKISKQINDLATYGCTALGPALVAAIELASKGSVGSKVILCTDGEANTGIGGEYNQDTVKFYQKAASYAKNKRVSVNILSLKGDNCNLKFLSKLSLATGGSLLKIDPKALGTQFSKIVQEQVLGCESKLVVKMNRLFQIIHPNKEQISKDLTTVTIDFGNFNSSTEVTFQFKTLDGEEVKKKKGVDPALFNRPRVPMQIHMFYTGRDGNKYLQIITDWRELTQNDDQLFNNMNFGVFTARIMQKASKHIKDGELEEAEKTIKIYSDTVENKFSKTQKKQTIAKFNSRVGRLIQVLKSKQKKLNKSSNVVFTNFKPRPKTTLIKKATKSKKLASKSVSKSASKSKKQMKVEDDEEEEDEQDYAMIDSDEEEEILMKGLRAKEQEND